MNQTDPKNRIDLYRWFVIQTKPAGEIRVEKNLSNQGIETFLPRYETFWSCRGRMVQSIRPLFPNYLFARLDLDLHYYKVKWTRGVHKILGSGMEPLPVSDQVIEAIKSRTGAGHLVELEEEWKEGDPVQIASGPFKDLTGIFQRKMSEKGRVRILLNLIGVDVPVQISKWQLKKVA